MWNSLDFKSAHCNQNQMRTMTSKMASALNEDSVEKKLRNVNNTQDSIQSLSLWIIHHKSHHAKIVELWMRVLKKTAHPSHRLTLFYLCNDVVQTCKKKKAPIYTTTFKGHLKEAACLVRDKSVKGKVERIFNIWQERNVYDAGCISTLIGILNGKLPKRNDKLKIIPQPLAKAKKNNIHSDGDSAKSRKPPRLEEEDLNGPISPTGSPYMPTPKQTQVPAPEEVVQHDAEESARILAEFKPHEMIEQIISFRRQESQIQLKVNQLTHLKLDASSLEAIKQLKDRAHGNDFSSQFEDSCTKYEDLVKHQTKHLEDQKTLVDVLTTSETFYEEQYREAKIVANAYKNFGARINNMKKRLDELKRSMPQPDSPIPSPDINAPSPGNTPPQYQGSGYEYRNSADPVDFDSSFKQNAWMYNGQDSFGTIKGRSALAAENTFQESPPLEAPSPEESPPDLNLENSDSIGTSLDSRLASFMDRSQRKVDQDNHPVYTPQMPRSLSSSSKSSRQGVAEEDGSTTPLNDEAPTTPVQDEHSSSPPKRSTPPKKENPIDFLSRLISQTQKTPSSKTGAPTFLDSLTMLTNITKPSIQTVTETEGNTTISQSWAAWKSKSSGSSTSPIQPSSPTSISSQPTSPTPFSRPPPTMVPPPIPLPVPPPSIPLNPPPLPPNMHLNVPPPPPPPFALTSGPPPDFSSPPPGFQQTSPSQKENWPEVAGTPVSDHSGANRPTAHSSVLKELTPAKSFEGTSTSAASSAANPSHSDTAPTPLIDPDAMEIVSDDDIGNGDSEEQSPGEAGPDDKEFPSKSKHKKDAASNLKSHVFVPNPERPNLVTLSAPDDLDEEDMIDEDTVMEDPPQWSSHSQKSRRSRSRSKSRDRERSHKHKKKKKHKRKDGDEDEVKSYDDDSRGVGSVVKKIDSRSSSSRSSRDKYEDTWKHDKYDDKKYDRHDDRKHSGRGEHKSSSFYNREQRLSRDSVEAYTQAFIQQYSQARYGSFGVGHSVSDPRRSGYGKY